MNLILGMGIYFLFLIILLCFSFLEIIKKNKILSIILIGVILVFVFLILTLKAPTVGQDAPAYEKIYNGAKEYSFFNFIKKHKTEFLFYIPLFFFSKFNIPSVVFWGMNYLLMCSMLFLGFKNTKRPVLYLSVFLLFGFFRMSFSGLRQSIAVSITSMALINYINSLSNNKQSRKQFWQYTLLILFAGLYHVSSLFLLLMPFLFKIKFDFKYVLVPFIFLPFISEIGGGLFTFISQNFSYVGFYQPISGTPSLLLLISVFAFFIYYGLFYFKPTKKFVNQFVTMERDAVPDKVNNANFVLFFAYCFFLSCNTFNGSLCRFSIYFYTCIPFFIDQFVFSFKKEKISKIIVGLLFTFLFVYFLYEGASIKIFPYEFIF